MQKRRAHTKSRKGCTACKRRRIKCDEQLPRCSYCVRQKQACIRPSDHNDPSLVLRGNGGFHADTSPSNAVADAGNKQTITLGELSHFHHFTTETYLTLDSVQSNGKIWQIIIPKLSFSHPFVFHGIVAVAALHQTALDPSEAETLLIQASESHNRALSTFRPSLNHIDETNCAAVVGFSMLTVVHAFATANIHAPGAAIADLVHCIQLAQGVGSILRPFWDLASKTELGPLLQSSSNHALVGEVPEILKLRELARLQTDPEAVSTYLDAIDRLHTTFLEVLIPDHKVSDLSIIFTWLVVVSERFSALISESDHVALIILAHFSVLFFLKRNYWWLNGWYERLLGAIEAELDAVEVEWLEWPKSIRNRRIIYV